MRCEAYHDMTNGRRSPSATTKSATVFGPSPRIATPARTSTASGPAIAEIPCPALRTHGTIEP